MTYKQKQLLQNATPERSRNRYCGFSLIEVIVITIIGLLTCTIAVHLNDSMQDARTNTTKTQIRADGSKHVGEFKEGYQNGQGTYT